MRLYCTFAKTYLRTNEYSDKKEKKNKWSDFFPLTIFFSAAQGLDS